MTTTALTATDTYTRRLLVFRGCHWITPYMAGFEDFRYRRAYANPFSNDTTEFAEYDAGNQDARRNQEKI